MNYTKLLLLVVLFLTSCAAPAPPTPVPTQMPTQTFTPDPTATQTPIPTQTITPSPTQVGGGSGRLIFTYRKDEFIKAFPNLKGETNVFVANVDGTNLAPVTNGLEGFNYLKDVSPDGTKVLIASTSKDENKNAILYLVDLSSNSEPVKIVDSVPNYRGHHSPAKWLDDSNIIYVGQGNSGFGIYRVHVDGANPVIIYQFNNDGEEYRPFEILALDLKNSRIYWDTHSKAPGLAAMYDVYSVWWSSFDGNSHRTPLEFNGRQVQFTNGGLVFSPDGTKVAWREETIPPSLHIASASDPDNSYTFETISSQLTMTWFPDSSKIVVFDQGSLPMCGEEPTKEIMSDLYGVYEVTVTSNGSIKNYHLPTEKLMTSESWGGNTNCVNTEMHDISPDGRQILLAILRSTAVGIDSKINFLNLEAISFSESSNSIFSNTIGDVHWIP